MEAGAASAGGIGSGAKAHDSGCHQSCCEQILHVFSLHLRRPAATDHFSCRVIRHVKYLRHAETIARDRITAT
jgi:hypothetical protein